jgi:hypothetical protein
LIKLNEEQSQESIRSHRTTQHFAKEPSDFNKNVILAGCQRRSSGVHFTFVFFLKPSPAFGLAFFGKFSKGTRGDFLKPHPTKSANQSSKPPIRDASPAILSPTPFNKVQI